jgi:hypothetical protein
VMPEVIPLWRRMQFKEEDVKLEISD